jgi:signal transduction histidine kinase
MIKSWFKKHILHSVHAKLVLICLVTWVCIVLVAAGLLLLHKIRSAQPFFSNAIAYFTYVANDLGTPPSQDKAREIFHRTGLGIAYNGGQTQWSLIRDLPDPEDIRYRDISRSRILFFGRDHGRQFVKFVHDNGVFVFEPAGNYRDEEHDLWIHLLLLISLTLIVIGAYLAIKKILNPIKWIHTGVREIGQGNLFHTVPEKRKDEFGKLASAFNVMTGRLRQMLNLKQRLLRDVSHELRSPLTRIKVELEFLEDEQAKKSIATDIREVESMITTILENSRLHHDHSTLTKKQADITRLIQDIVEGFDHREPGVDFKHLSPLFFAFDPDQMKTVITNLIENGIKYSLPHSRPVQIGVSKEKERVRITVRDTGMGMDESKLPLVLEPFYRLDKSRSKKTGGFGLGLSLCKTIMEAHGGKIRIQSRPDKGTCVTLLLPLD